MSALLTYDGQTLAWDEPGNSATYKASSGLLGSTHRMFRYGDDIYVFQEDYRCTWYEKVMDHGPIPTGLYQVATTVPKNPYAAFDASVCGLTNSFSVQQIPRGGDPADPPARTTAGSCEDYWANWGFHRAGLIPFSGMVAPHRSGFYLHDSSKGFTHGCVETEQKFFSERLYPFVAKSAGAKLMLSVKYAKGRFRTYGGTFVAGSTPGVTLPDEAIQRDTLDVFSKMCGWLSMGGLQPPGPVSAGVAASNTALDAKYPRPKHLALDPPPQEKLRLYDYGMNLSLGRNPVAGLSSAVVDKVPGRWGNFV